MPQEVYASLLAQLPTEDDENDDVDREQHQEGSHADPADGIEAAGDCLAIATRSTILAMPKITRCPTLACPIHSK